MGKKKAVASTHSGLGPLKPRVSHQDHDVGDVHNHLNVQKNLAGSVLLAPASSVDPFVEKNPPPSKIPLSVVCESPSVSLTLGDDDTVSINSESQSHTAEVNHDKEDNAAGNVGGKEVKVPWSNVFKDNRKIEENIKLKSFHTQSDEVVFG